MSVSTATVILNGAPRVVQGRALTYEEIVELARYKPGTVVSVTFKRAGLPRPEGLLSPGETIAVLPGTVINALVTGNG